MDTQEHSNPPIGTLTLTGFCKLYNVGRTLAYEEIKAGRLRAQKAGTKTLIRKRDAEAWAAALPVLDLGRPANRAIPVSVADQRTSVHA